MKSNSSNFDINEFSTIDIKALIYKVLSYWKWFALSLLIAFFATKYINDYKERIYSLDSLITVKDEQNPIFSSSTNIAFNWGGSSDLVETIKTILKSRTHNEKVVQQTQFYVDYLHEGKYRMEDVYGRVPFEIKVDTSHYQLIGTLMKLEFISDNKVRLSIDYKEDLSRKLLHYHTNKKQIFNPKNQLFSHEYTIGNVENDFLSFKINKKGIPQVGQIYYIRFNDFDSKVEHYRNLKVTSNKGTSIIKLKLDGANKNRLVDYLNTTVRVLSKDQIDAKIQYAVKTKNYIDELFKEMAGNLKTIEKDLGSFKQSQSIYNLSTEGSAIFEEAIQLDSKAQHFQDRLDYFNSLGSYIRTNESIDANAIPAPAVIEMEDSNISKSIGVLVSKYKAREVLLETVTPSYPPLKQLEHEIELERSTLLENIAMLKQETNKALTKIKNRLNSNQYKLKKLPKKEQQLLSFERQYAITEQNYNYLKQKSYEAGTAIASNVSDIKTIDTAKDTGQKPISPNTLFNTLIGFLLALILPLIYILLKEFLNNKIQTVEEVEEVTEIPILGVIGTKTEKTDLLVFEHSKSPISEAYRALRSNMQFMLKRGAKSNVILVTSSISGEGKTLTSINLASVFAVSEKKTILVGVDLRKPKIAEEFGLKANDLGLSHYLSGQKTVDEVINKNLYKNFDLMLSGPVPPNPSELLLSEKTAEMMAYLRENYEYIILDAPPIGAVSDAQELFQYTDSIVYLIRQGHSEKGLLKIIESKHKRGELPSISYVLNDFTFSKRNGYGYGGYGYGYGYYEKEATPWYKRIFSSKK